MLVSLERPDRLVTLVLQVWVYRVLLALPQARQDLPDPLALPQVRQVPQVRLADLSEKLVRPE